MSTPGPILDENWREGKGCQSPDSFQREGSKEGKQVRIHEISRSPSSYRPPKICVSDGPADRRTDAESSHMRPFSVLSKTVQFLPFFFHHTIAKRSKNSFEAKLLSSKEYFIDIYYFLLENVNSFCINHKTE